LLTVAVLGCLGTAAAFAAFAALAGRAGATRASVTVYFVPAVAVALGAALRGEPITPAAIAGTALVLAGARMVGRTGSGTRHNRRPANR
jgi:drug/metabolite transporter (DMT)-like permease